MLVQDAEMARAAATLEQVLTLLEQTPQRIETITGGLSDRQLGMATAPGEWSAVEILAHLRSCSDVWGGCIERILAEDHPTIRATNPTTYVGRTDYPTLEFGSSWAAYVAQRAAPLAVLHGLKRKQWERGAAVTGAGRPVERTLRGYAEWLAVHERTHIKQFSKAIGHEDATTGGGS